MKLRLPSVRKRSGTRPRPSKEAMRELGSRGGKASAEARRRKRLEAEAAELRQAPDVNPAQPGSVLAGVLGMAAATDQLHTLGLPFELTRAQIAALAADYRRREADAEAKFGRRGAAEVSRNPASSRDAESISIAAHPDDFDRERLRQHALARLDAGLSLNDEEAAVLGLREGSYAPSPSDTEPIRLRPLEPDDFDRLHDERDWHIQFPHDFELRRRTNGRRQ